MRGRTAWRRRAKLPPLSSPFAIRLSSLLLRQVVLIYVLLVMAWVGLMSGLLHLLRAGLHCVALAEGVRHGCLHSAGVGTAGDD